MTEAEKKYRFYTELIKTQLAELTTNLDNHRVSCDGNINYGHVGDLAHISETLRLINHFSNPETISKVNAIRGLILKERTERINQS